MLKKGLFCVLKYWQITKVIVFKKVIVDYSIFRRQNEIQIVVGKTLIFLWVGGSFKLVKIEELCSVSSERPVFLLGLHCVPDLTYLLYLPGKGYKSEVRSSSLKEK